MISTAFVLIVFHIYFSFAHSNTPGELRLIHGKIFGKNSSLNPIRAQQKPLPKDVTEAWVEQSVDHNDSGNNPLWHQRYFAKFAKHQESPPEGPILIYIGGEEELDPSWLIEGMMAEHAKSLKSPAIFALEHRFYGQSWPLNDTTMESLRYLTMGQALQDIAKFIMHIKTTHDFQENKIVLYGGSYPAALVSYFREIFPHLADVSLASSAPIDFRFDFKEYLESVGSSFKKTSPECLKIIQNGFAALDAKVRDAQEKCTDRNNDPCQLNLNPLQVCVPSELTAFKSLDIQSLQQEMTSTFSYFAQYNATLGNGLRELCDLTLSLKALKGLTDYEAFARTAQATNLFLLKSSCFDPSHDRLCTYLGGSSREDHASKYGARQWAYQICNEFGSLQTTSSDNQPFGKGVTPQLFVKQCQCAFGDKFDEIYIQSAVLRHKEQFGSLNRRRTKVIYTQGQNDPIGQLGYTNPAQLFPEAQYEAHGDYLFENEDNALIIIKDGSHCMDMKKYAKDPLPVIQKSHFDFDNQVAFKKCNLIKLF